MIILKKLIFAPVFLIAFFLLIYQISPVVKSYDLIFSISTTSLAQLIIISALISLASLLFVLFAFIASDWRLILPVGILGSLIPFIFLEIGLAIVLAVGILVSLLLSFLGVENSHSLLGPSIRHLSGLLILSFCLVYFLAVNKMVVQNGFQIPDSLIDATIQFTQPKTGQEESATPQISLPQEQLDLLKQNPDLLKQSGFDPKILDTLNQPQKSSKAPQDLTNDLLKQTIKDQLQALIKPYSIFIPVILALLLFFTLKSLASIINLLIYPLLWITFYILEKSGFIKFTTEMRPVKKMVV